MIKRAVINSRRLATFLLIRSSTLLAKRQKTPIRLANNANKNGDPQAAASKASEMLTIKPADDAG